MAFTIAHRFTRAAIMQDGQRRALLADWAEAHPEDFRGIALPSKRSSGQDTDVLARTQGQVTELQRLREEDRKHTEQLEARVREKGPSKVEHEKLKATIAEYENMFRDNGRQLDEMIKTNSELTDENNRLKLELENAKKK